MANCLRCNSEFTPKNKRQRWCSKSCCNLWYYERGVSGEHVCQVCSKPFRPKAANRTTTCSRECGFEFIRRTVHARRSEEAKAKVEAKRLSRLFENLRQCSVCNAAFVASSKAQVVCGGDDCRRKRNWQSLGIPLVKWCRLCGDKECEMVNGYRSMHCPDCRDELSRAARRRAKHARDGRLSLTSKAGLKRAETVAGIQSLIAQSGQQCPCCGLLMSRSTDPHSDRALELDHAVPVSRGGRDEWPNIRCLCRRCNGLKGAFIATSVVVGEWLNVHECNGPHHPPGVLNFLPVVA